MTAEPSATVAETLNVQTICHSFNLVIAKIPAFVVALGDLGVKIAYILGAGATSGRQKITQHLSTNSRQGQFTPRRTSESP
jgi:hypothetical protein